MLWRVEDLHYKDAKREWKTSTINMPKHKGCQVGMGCAGVDWDHTTSHWDGDDVTTCTRRRVFRNHKKRASYRDGQCPVMVLAYTDCRSVLEGPIDIESCLGLDQEWNKS